MTKKARSARGDLVDFDLLAIKDQLASAPVPISANNRRKFIDEKDGIKSKAQALPATPAAPPEVPSALAFAMAAVQESESLSSEASSQSE